VRRGVLVKHKALIDLFAGLGELNAQAGAAPCFALVYGPPGTGKTTASHSVVGLFNGVRVRVMALTTPGSFLGAIAEELDIYVKRSATDKLRAVIEALKQTPRPLIIDEVDRLADGDRRLLEILRDVHDESSVPVVLIGEEKMPGKLKRWPQLEQRITHFIPFGPLDMDDARLATRDLCEVEIADELVARAHKDSSGRLRLLVGVLRRFETFAKARDLERLSEEVWDERSGSDRPTSERKFNKVKAAM